MKHYRLAFLGFGNVGKALGELLLRKRSDIETMNAVSTSVTGIATSRHGTAIDPGGIDLTQALELMEQGDSLDSISKIPSGNIDPLAFIRDCNADVLFESIPVNYQTGQPAVDYIRSALKAGMHIVTANKGPVVHAYQELTALAESMGVKFYFESAVMDGAPVFGLFRETIPAARVLAFQGVLNSTTNLMLSRMETGDSFDEAIQYAQSIGIAETDPSGDIDGWDAAVKVSALATVLMGVPTKPAEVDRTGIRGITPQDITSAREDGTRLKLVCEARWDGERLHCKVSPQKVSINSPLYGVEGTTSIVQIETDVLGKLSLIEEDPGPHTTAYGMLADFLNAVG
jgi:homoserine dehydrogenase